MPNSVQHMLHTGIATGFSDAKSGFWLSLSAKLAPEGALIFVTIISIFQRVFQADTLSSSGLIMHMVYLSLWPSSTQLQCFHQVQLKAEGIIMLMQTALRC